MNPIFIAIYVVLCLLVGTLGAGTRLGFFRTFLLAALLTPFPITIALLVIGALDRKTANLPVDRHS